MILWLAKIRSSADGAWQVASVTQPKFDKLDDTLDETLMVLFGAVRNHARHAGLNLGIKERVVQVVRTLRAGIVNDDLR
jgi:hypothetical protein